MSKIILLGIVGAAWLSLYTTEASAIVCAKGVHGAGCVSTRGAVARRGVVVRRPGAVAHRRTVVRR
ncbi:MAG: hypothetical protein WBX25_21370 [Rhodomicrobium sp.]